MEIEVSLDIDAPAEEAVDLLGDFALLSDYHPQVASCLVEGEGVGAIRTCTLADGSSMIERLESDARDGYSFAMLEGPEALARYEGSLRITAREGGCRAILRVSFEAAPGHDVDELEATLRGILETGLESAKRTLEG